ncbi:MAG: hypothetical protein QOK19_852 [Solirubrobacteraceae bacterium]|nr:hypothetical protein [Solirubrobacteraceae bacterium]
MAYGQRGETLLRDAAAIADQEAFRFWQLRKSSWVAETVATLRDEVDIETLRTFQRALRPPPGEGEIYEDLSVELEGLRRGLAVLLGLGEQTAKRS